MEPAPRHPTDSVAAAGETDATFAAAAWQRDVRLRALLHAPHGPHRLTRLRRWAWFLAILLHVVVVVGLRVALRKPVPHVRDSVVQVDLVSAPVAEPPLPEPAPLPPPPVAQARPQSTPRVPRPVPAAPPAAAEGPALSELRLFTPDGSANVPDDLAARIDRARPRPDFIAREYLPSPLLQAKRPLKVRPNHFAQYWAGTDGMTAYDAMWRHVTFVKEFRAPWGGRFACAWVLIIVACGDVPEKPWTPPQAWKPATELDER
jgi:hypothetical protein